MSHVVLDLNTPEFLDDWFHLEKTEAIAVLDTLKKIRGMDWDLVYKDRGLRWETIISRKGPGGQRIYSLRITRKVRTPAYRDRDFLRLLSLHPDHDSAY